VAQGATVLTGGRASWPPLRTASELEAFHNVLSATNSTNTLVRSCDQCWRH